MTDQEWLASEDPGQMEEFLKKKQNRKYRLAAVAACNLFSDQLTDERSREALAVAERFADEKATKSELETAYTNARAAYEALHAAYLESAEMSLDDETVCNLARAAAETTFLYGDCDFDYELVHGYGFQGAAVLREVFGPRTPPSFDRAWLTATVTTLAQTIYDEHAFDRLPILADALEDAGCTEAIILNHLRGSADRCVNGVLIEHVRGCWALDLILNR